MAGEQRPTVKAEAFWGTIMASARQRATTAQVWDAIRGRADELGVRYAPGILADVNRLRSLATGLAETSRRIARASDDQAITGRMIGQQVYARGLAGQALAPGYHVRFQVPVTTPEGTRTDWYTLEYQGAFPATKGQLLADLGAYTDSLGEDYGVSIGEIGAIEIGAF